MMTTNYYNDIYRGYPQDEWQPVGAMRGAMMALMSSPSPLLYQGRTHV